MTEIVELDKIYCTWTDYKWPLQYDSRVQNYFHTLKSENSNLWDGDILLSCAHMFSNSTLNATFFTAKYSTFCAVRDGIVFLPKESSVRNLSPAAAVITSDRRVVIGRMSDKTSTPGSYVLPGGIPSPSDICDSILHRCGVIYLENTLRRELLEETSLVASGLITLPGWILVLDKWRMIAVKKYKCLSSSVYISKQSPDGELSDLSFIKQGDSTDHLVPWAALAVEHILWTYQ